MNYLSKSKIIAIESYVPEKILTNADFEKMVDTSDEWIVKRTGVKERRQSAPDEFSSDLAIKAVERLIKEKNVIIDDVDMIIVTTFTPDHMTPTVSGLVQGHFGIKATGSIDLSAACTGFTYGMWIADSLITAGRCKKVLIISSEVVTKIIDYTDRNSCILFGDAAVAVLLERSEEGSFFGGHFLTEGNLAENVTCSTLSNKVNSKKLEKKMLFEQEGKFLYEYVVKNVPEGVRQLLSKSDMTLDDIDWFVPHSANLRMIEALCKRLKFPIERTLISNEYHGNTSSASIPLAISLADHEDKIKRGDKLLLYGFGGGLTHGGVIVKW